MANFDSMVYCRIMGPLPLASQVSLHLTDVSFCLFIYIPLIKETKHYYIWQQIKMGFFWIHTITIFEVRRNAITIRLFQNIPLQFFASHKNATEYVWRQHGPSCKCIRIPILHWRPSLLPLTRGPHMSSSSSSRNLPIAEPHPPSSMVSSSST